MKSNQSSKESSKGKTTKGHAAADKKGKGASAVMPDSDSQDKPTTKGSNGYGATAANTSSRNTSSYGSGAENANGGGYES